MAHIADLMVGADTIMGLNNYIARELSPPPVQDAGATEAPNTQGEDKEKFVWRMHQPTESRKYQLFPAKDKLSIAAQKSQEEMSNTSEKAQIILGGGLRGKAKEQTIVRRRKVSVPELGPTPMTTVQEVAMDSPTIPGRPALHERSISAPGNSWRQHPFGESMLSCISGPALDENAEMILDAFGQEEMGNHLSRTFTPALPKQPVSPKTLAPLVIPSSSSHRLNSKNSSSRLRSGSIPPDVPPKSARMREGSGSSPYPRASPYTPMSASSTALLSATTAATSLSNTPNSAFPPLLEGRTSSPSPQPWASTATLATCLPTRSTTPAQGPTNGHSRNQSDTLTGEGQTQNPRAIPLTHTHSHRRHESEGAASIMDRGRPKKRSETSPSANTSPVKPTRSQSKSGRSHSLSNSKPSSSPSPPPDAASEREKEVQAAKEKAKAEAQHAFEHLPTGIRPHLTPNHLPLSELALLKKQALGQASRFQVLPSHAVESLSRELRALDERCDYLRKTHRSLRSGRRNLHERICNALRGERTAIFSREALLRQEEALSELDNSIDDWVAKLEQAENRRTRVRQKLLEHVAAALIIPEPASGLGISLNSLVSTGTGQKAHVVTMAADVPTDPNTPPRSPTKGQSPERLERVVEEVKFSSPEPKRGGRHVESIRIYADSDVYALLADVEEEIERMGADAADRVNEEKEIGVEIKKDDVLSPGITLHAVAFEGMIAHKRSYGTMKVQEGI